jgi:hypothetical protein
VILQFSEFVVDVVGVAAFDARFAFAEPPAILLFGKARFFPKKELRLLFVGGAEDIGIVDQAFFEKLVCVRVDPVDSAILVIGKPDQKVVFERTVVTQGLKDGVEVYRHIVEQIFAVAVKVADRTVLHLLTLAEGFDVFGIDRRIEDEVKIDALTRAAFIDEHICHQAFDDRKQRLAFQLIQRFPVRFITLCGCARITKATQHFAVPGNRKIVIDANNITIRVAKLDDELIVITGKAG